MSFVILGIIVLLIMVALGLGKSLGAQSLVNEVEDSVGTHLTDLKDRLEEWWLTSAIPRLKRLVLGLAISCVLAAAATLVLALAGKVEWGLCYTVGGIASVGTAWLVFHWYRKRGEFSAADALNASILTVAAIGIGIYLYGQMTSDSITSLIGYLVVVAASEVVCALVVTAAWLMARVVQVSEGSANVGLQFVREVLFSGNVALQKIVDMNFANEEEFVPNAQAWNARLRLHRDSIGLIGILLPSPLTSPLVIVAGLAYSVCVRTYMGAASYEEADKYRKGAAKNYVLAVTVLLAMIAVRYLPDVLGLVPNDPSLQGIKGICESLKHVFAHPTAYLAIAAVLIALRLPKPEPVDPKNPKGTSAFGVAMYIAVPVLFIAYWVMWGKVVFYVLPVALFALWLVSRSSIRGALMCLGAGYLLVLIFASLLRTGHIAKEGADYTDISQRIEHGNLLVPVSASAAPSAPVPPPSASAAPTVTATAKTASPTALAKAHTPTPAAEEDDEDDSPSAAPSPAWAVLCRQNPNLASCKH